MGNNKGFTLNDLQRNKKIRGLEWLSQYYHQKTFPFGKTFKSNK